jgi:hypothetical protein
MDSSLSIGRTGAGTYQLRGRMPLFRFFRTIRTSNFYIKLASLRHLGTKVLLLIDVLVGLWLAGTYIYVFHALSNGGTVGEPDILIARTELWLSIGVTCWFLWQIPYWVLKLLREPKVFNSTQTVGEDKQEKDG